MQDSPLAFNPYVVGLVRWVMGLRELRRQGKAIETPIGSPVHKPGLSHVVIWHNGLGQ